MTHTWVHIQVYIHREQNAHIKADTASPAIYRSKQLAC